MDSVQGLLDELVALQVLCVGALWSRVGCGRMQKLMRPMTRMRRHVRRFQSWLQQMSGCGDGDGDGDYGGRDPWLARVKDGAMERMVICRFLSASPTKFIQAKIVNLYKGVATLCGRQTDRHLFPSSLPHSSRFRNNCNQDPRTQRCND